MKEFQVAVTYEARGYITVRAKNANDAKAKVRGLFVGMDYEGCDANIDMMPLTPDLRIDGEPEIVEPEAEDE